MTNAGSAARNLFQSKIDDKTIAALITQDGHWPLCKC